MSDINFGDPFARGTAEELEQAAEQRFSPPVEESTEQQETETPSPEAGQEGVETPSTPPALPEEFDLSGRRVTRADVEAWAQFDNLLRSDPRLAQTIYDYLHGSPSSAGVGGAPGTGQGAVSAPAPSTPEPGWGVPPTPASQPAQTPTPPSPQIDPELLQDPGVAFLYNQIQEQNRLLDNFRSEIGRLSTITSSRMQADSRTVIDTAVAEFKQTYGIDDATVEAVKTAAARLEVIPAILNRGIDPITGQPTDPNPLNAVRRAMEIAAHSIPEVRDRIIQSQLLIQQQDELRKRRLNGVGGASRTLPRNPPAPTNPQDIRSAMISEVASAMQAANGQEQ